MLLIMAVLSYKCPNCSGPLKFSADKQAFNCEYCNSDFTQSDLERIFGSLDAEEKTTPEAARAARRAQDLSPAEDKEFAEKVMAYSCPSCGAEIITSETTAAATCYYCHNPVVISGRLSQEFRPDKIIPFAISKEKAVEGFKNFCEKKKFLPNNFYSNEQFENMRGVYFPYYLIAANAAGSLLAEGRNVKTWVAGDIEYTETTIYDVKRSGEVFVDGISLSALKDSDHNMLKYVCPYDEGKVVDFKMPYLSGFEAEKRDQGKAELGGEASSIISNTATNLLRNTISGYSFVNVKNSDCKTLSDKWDYALFPVWVMTHRFGDKTYIYAMNGQTGKLYGKLPVSKGRLAALFGGLFAGIFALLFLILLYGGGLI